MEAVIKSENEEKSFPLAEKKFKTGSRGYYGFGKMEISGKRYQANLMLIEIGSKNQRKD